jgi:hypothetical protein
VVPQHIFLSLIVGSFHTILFNSAFSYDSLIHSIIQIKSLENHIMDGG